MKVVVLGANGATGRLIVPLAREQGHEVTAFVRDPASLEPHPDVRVAVGDVLDRATLDAALSGQEAVIFAVGSGGLGRSTLRTDGARNTVAAMEGAGVRRIVAMSGLGAGDSRQALPFPVRFFVAPVILGRLLADQDGLEAALAASGVAWTAVRAGELKDEPARGGWRVALDGRVSTAVARADVARFLVEQLTDDTYVGKTPAIGYP